MAGLYVLVGRGAGSGGRTFGVSAGLGGGY